ncbi:hypothetical protein N1851_006092 [Merluccius polli]|uniref:Uncharacterized protein n=1 Tax=Merluccius polli TaxID=89951 RepID=A0AA47N4R1_MERPO|nr:hypothetical protein N1851_006092 [Merluccius polli]
MPAAPVSQSAGAGLVVGMAASVLMLVSGVVFLSYRLPPGVTSVPPPPPAPWIELRPRGPLNAAGGREGAMGKHNLAFESHERL